MCAVAIPQVATGAKLEARLSDILVFMSIIFMDVRPGLQDEHQALKTVLS